MKFYKLDDQKNVVECDFIEMALSIESGPTRVALTEIDEYVISTVFIGFDMSNQFVKEVPPIVFESMIFHNGLAETIVGRYPTWAEAEVGHMEAVESLQRSFASAKYGSNAVIESVRSRKMQ